MSTYKKRNPRKFEADIRGIRSSWAQIDRLYDGNGTLPNDSETFGRQLLDYVALLSNDVNASSDPALRNLDESTYRTDDGYGGSTWDLTEEYNPAVIAAYDELAKHLKGTIGDEFFNTNGGLRPSRFKTEYNLVVTDSDGVMTTKNVFVVLKQFVPEWMDFDFFARKKVASSVAQATDEDSDIATDLTNSVKRVLGDSTDPIRIRGDLTVEGSTTLNGDLILGDAAADSLVVNATTDFTNGVDLNGDVTIGDANTDTLTVNAGTTLTDDLTVEGNTILGNAASDTLTVNADATLTDDLTVEGVTTLNGNSIIGNAASDTLTVNADTSLTDDLTVAGVTTLNGNTTIGDAAGDTLNINATTTVATVGANQVVFGDAAGNLDGNANLTWNGSTLNVTGATTVSGLTTLNGGLTMDGGVFTVANTSGNVHTSGTLDVDGNTNLDGTLRVDGDTDFNGKAGITATTGVIQTDSLAGTGVRSVSVDAAGNLTTATPTGTVGLIIFDSAGTTLKTIYAPAV